MIAKNVGYAILSIPKKFLRLLQATLRAIYAGPRLRHAGSGLDMCYVSQENPTIIALSRPTSSFPLSLVCNPTNQVLEHLQKFHPTSTHTHLVLNLRGETPGYLDSELYPARVHHAPWPDHHPPPMHLLLNTIEELDAFYSFAGDERNKVALVHCKAGKGRSGTLISSYLIAHHNMTAVEAMALYTTKRMRKGFGEGVSIRSQRRYVNYMEDWVVNLQRRYVDRKVKINTVSVWGLKGDVEVSIGGYVPVENCPRGTWELGPLWRARGAGKRTNVVWHPDLEVRTADVCLGVQRWIGGGWIKICKTRAWFNAVMEAAKREGDSQLMNGTFEIPWEEMDGLKGTAVRGRRAFERCVVEWEFVDDGQDQGEAHGVRDIELVNPSTLLDPNQTHGLADDVTVVGDSGDEAEKLMCAS